MRNGIESVQVVNARLGTSSGDFRLNSSGQALGNVKSRTSLYYTNIIQAGATLPVPASGTQFYVVFSTAAINVRPSDGVFVNYVQGTGLQLQEINSFQLLEVNNPNAFPVIFQMFVGFDEYIDKRLILNNTTTPAVIFPTYTEPGTAVAVAINDLSGQAFSDINGKAWYAIQRIAILIFNPDTGVTLLVQGRGATGSAGDAVGAVYPLTSLRLDASGDYALSLGGTAINAIVSEIYQAIAA